MDNMSKQLIKHCSPTLAGMKTAGLFGFSQNSTDAGKCIRDYILNADRLSGSL